MKKLGFLALALAALPALGQVYVQPHVTANGTYVQGHWRSAPDHTPQNNYGTQGNVNPYTGQAGTVNPYAQPQLQPIQPLQPLQPFGRDPNHRPQGRAF